MEQTKLKIAHGRPSLLVLVVVGALALAAPGAQAQAEAESGGLAGDACQLNSECMSRTCGADRLCVATTCGLSAALGGVGATAPSGYCSATTVYNPSRVCTFGFGKCAKAECCDTVSCSAGVKDQDKSTYCAKDQSFNSIRLCPNGVCSPSVCCAQTKCDGPGGVVVNKRATFCPSGLVFNNAGVCLGGNARCTSDDCCALDTRTCGVAFDDPQYKGGACPAPSRLVESRLFDEAKGEKGGCCETTTCATGVADSDKKAYCDGTSASTVFSGTPTCASGTCTQTDCCQSPKGFCDGTATQAPDGSCTCSEPNRSFLIGVGCACSAGFYLADGTTCTACPHGRYTGSPNTLPECAACPSNQPYTPSTATASADKCINYCDDRQFNGADQGVCSNGGTCASLTGDPAQGGAFSCTCPPLWMYYPPPQSTSTTPTNCDAPTTLLRVRILAAGGVTIPSNLKLLVT